MAFTYFFRDTQVLELAVNHVVPFVAGRRNVRFWDAGCAMGPEPYTLAILCAEKMGYFAFKNLKIFATDVDTCNLFGDIIGKGEYKKEELERIPKDLYNKYFEQGETPEFARIIENVRSRVFFQKHNLLSLEPIGDDFSLIVCKNVLLHFNESERIDVLKMYHNCLSPGGYIAMEQTQKLPKSLSGLFTQVTSDGQLYKKVST